MSFVKEKGGCCLKEREKKKKEVSRVSRSPLPGQMGLCWHTCPHRILLFISLFSHFFCVFEIETGGEDPFVVNPRHFHHLFPGKQERERKKKKCEKMYRHNNSKQSVGDTLKNMCNTRYYYIVWVCRYGTRIPSHFSSCTVQFYNDTCPIESFLFRCGQVSRSHSFSFCHVNPHLSVMFFFFSEQDPQVK